MTLDDILQVQGVKAKGFGIIPKLVMQDRRLTAEAKAIYSYFCSFAGAGRTAFPTRSKIISDLGLSINRYYKHFNLLKENGYIRVEQENKQGQFRANVYTLLEDVPCIQNKDKSPCIKFAYTENAYTQNEHTNNNNTKNNSIKNNNRCYNIMSSQSCQQNNDRSDTTELIEAYTERIRTNICYDDFKVSHPYDMALIDEFVAIIVDTVLSDSKVVRICGEDKPRELVKSVLMKLEHGHFEHALGQFKGVTERITKKKSYILAILYNSSMELDLHYTNLVKSDFVSDFDIERG